MKSLQNIYIYIYIYILTEREHHRSRGKEKKRDKIKYFTADPDLLLAFVYFDQTHTGYLLDKDVEEIIHTLGLHLSRAQVTVCVCVCVCVISEITF